MPGHIDLNSLPTLDAQLSRGEEVLLTRNGTVVARVTPVGVGAGLTPEEKRRMAALRRAAFGKFAGQIDVEAFERPLPDEMLEAMMDPEIFPREN